VANGYGKSGRKSVVNPTIKVLKGEARLSRSKSDGGRASGGSVGPGGAEREGAAAVAAAAAEEEDRVEVKVLTVAATVLLAWAYTRPRFSST